MNCLNILKHVHFSVDWGVDLKRWKEEVKGSGQYTGLNRPEEKPGQDEKQQEGS